MSSTKWFICFLTPLITWIFAGIATWIFWPRIIDILVEVGGWNAADLMAKDGSAPVVVLWICILIALVILTVFTSMTIKPKPIKPKHPGAHSPMVTRKWRRLWRCNCGHIISGNYTMCVNHIYRVSMGGCEDIYLCPACGTDINKTTYKKTAGVNVNPWYKEPQWILRSERQGRDLDD